MEFRSVRATSLVICQREAGGAEGLLFISFTATEAALGQDERIRNRLKGRIKG